MGLARSVWRSILELEGEVDDAPAGASGAVVAVAEVAFDDPTFGTFVPFSPPVNVAEGDIIYFTCFSDVGWDQQASAKVSTAAAVDASPLSLSLFAVGDTDGVLRKEKDDQIARVEAAGVLGYKVAALDPEFPPTIGRGHIYLVIHRPA